MKKTYQNPTMKVVKIQTVKMIATSNLRVGNAYQENDAVLSRRGGSSWDDEEDY